MLDDSVPVIDAHAHLILPPAAHIQSMDEAGIGKSVLLMSRPHPERATDLHSFKAEMSVLSRVTAGASALGFAGAMAELHATLREWPSRYIGFGGVPMDEPSRIGSWVSEEIVGRGLKGIGEISPPVGQAALVEPVFQAAADHGGRYPILLHAAAPQTAEDIATYIRLAARYSRVPIIIGQLGGPNWLSTIEAVKEATPNVFVDLGTPQTWYGPFLAAREIPDRAIFASAAPYGDPLTSRIQVQRATDSREALARIMSGNLLDILSR